MWRDRERYPEHNLVPDTFWLVVAVVLFAACGLVWLIGQVAAIVFGLHHQHLPVRLVDMLGVLLRLPGTWDDPAQAWPPDTWPLLPGPVGMYAAAILTFWLPALLYGLLVRLLSRGPAAAASNGGLGGPASGSSGASSWSALGGGGSSSAAATASETASSAGSTWPSNNATRSWPSDRQGRSRPTGWSSRPSWNGKGTWSPPPSNRMSCGPPAPTEPTSGPSGSTTPSASAASRGRGGRHSPTATAIATPEGSAACWPRPPTSKGTRRMTPTTGTARRQAPVGAAVRRRRDGAKHGRRRQVGGRPGRR
jgi:hypothetical protein